MDKARIRVILEQVLNLFLIRRKVRFLLLQSKCNAQSRCKYAFMRFHATSAFLSYLTVSSCERARSCGCDAIDVPFTVVYHPSLWAVVGERD